MRRSSISNNKIWISIGETTCIDRTCIANAIIDAMKEDENSEVFFLTFEVIETLNHSTITMLFDNAVKLLCPNSAKSKDIILFITNTATYMTKSEKELQTIYAKMPL